MRKTVVFVVFVLSVTAAFASAVAGEKGFYVGPFKKGEPFLTPKIQEQILEGVEDIPEGASVKILGYTDSLGPPDFNAKLARWRAEEVAEEIKNLAPEVKVAQVEGRPYGGENGDVNYRAARVEFSSQKEEKAKATPATPSSSSGKQTEDEVAKLSGQTENLREEVADNSEQVSELRSETKEGFNNLSGETKEGFKTLSGEVEEQGEQTREQARELKSEIRESSDSWKFWTLLVLLVAGFAVLALVVWRTVAAAKDRISQEVKAGKDDLSRQLRKKDEKEAETSSSESSSEKSEPETQPEAQKSSSEQPTEEWVKINSHKVRVEVTPDRIYLPFISSHGEKMYRSSRRDVKKALKGAFKKESFAEQVEKLKKEGKIIEEN